MLASQAAMLDGSLAILLAPAYGKGDIVASMIVEVSRAVKRRWRTQEVLHAVQ